MRVLQIDIVEQVPTALTMLPIPELDELYWMVAWFLGPFLSQSLFENNSDDNCGKHKLLLHVGVFEVATQKAIFQISQSYLISYIILPCTLKYFKVLKIIQKKRIFPKQSNLSTCFLPIAVGNKREFLKQRQK